jgi:hypothetical protein
MEPLTKIIAQNEFNLSAFHAAGRISIVDSYLRRVGDRFSDRGGRPRKRQDAAKLDRAGCRLRRRRLQNQEIA